MDGKQITNQREDSVLSAVVSVVGSFAPAPEARTVLERWFADPTFDWHFSATLMNSLARCCPENYPYYLQQFLLVVKTHPRDFDLDCIFGELARLVGPETLVGHWCELPEGDLIALIKGLKGMSTIESYPFEVIQNPWGLRERVNGRLHVANFQSGIVAGISLQE